MRLLGVFAAVLGAVGLATAPAEAATVPQAGQVIFTPVSHGKLQPNASFGCSVTNPQVIDTFSTGTLSWSAGEQCSMNLQMQGTTVLFVWGSSNAYAFGSSYNTFKSMNSSTGRVGGIFTGTWGVNNNVLITIPAGYTTTLGAGCAFLNNNTQLKCTATTGPVQAHGPGGS
jgi:hypothetical protein